MSEVLKHPNDETLLSDYIRKRRTDRLDEWSMDALANDITRLESKVKELEVVIEHALNAIDIHPDGNHIMTASEVLFRQAIRKAVEGE